MGTRVGIAEFLEKVAKLKKNEEKVAALKESDCFALRTVLQAAFDPRIKFLLPEGDAPYKPNDLVDQENVFFAEARKLVHFVEGGNPGLKQLKREAIFIELLETVAPADAKMLMAIKDKKSPFKGLTAEVAKQAFPDLFPQENTK